jgi:hypothetical protein
MIEWLLLPGQNLQPVRTLLGRAWRGPAVLHLLQASPRARPVTVVVPEGARALRGPRWPDVLSDWADIYEEPLFPSPLLPVAGEVLSESGSECLALFADLGAPGGARGGIAWYQKGAVVELEQVGQAAVAWQPGQPLSRPRLASVRAQLASLGRAVADTDRDAGLYERVEAGLSATAEAILLRALIRLLGDDPPPIDALAGAVLAAPAQRIALP